MEKISSVTIQELWPHLCDLGMLELRINARTVWSDFALDTLFNKAYYDDAVKDYLQCSKDYIFEQYDSFRVSHINIRVIEFHHCIVDISGYFAKENEETSVQTKE